MDYKLCRQESAATLINGVKTDFFMEREPIEQKLFEKILAGLEISTFTKPFARNFLKDCQ